MVLERGGVNTSTGRRGSDTNWRASPHSRGGAVAERRGRADIHRGGGGGDVGARKHGGADAWLDRVDGLSELIGANEVVSVLVNATEDISDLVVIEEVAIAAHESIEDLHIDASSVQDVDLTEAV